MSESPDKNRRIKTPQGVAERNKIGLRAFLSGRFMLPDGRSADTYHTILCPGAERRATAMPIAI